MQLVGYDISLEEIISVSMASVQLVGQSITVVLDSSVSVTGVYATVAVSSLTIWTEVSSNDTQTWTEVATADSDTWTEVPAG
jgi:hypothetical protein